MQCTAVAGYDRDRMITENHCTLKITSAAPWTLLTGLVLVRLRSAYSGSDCRPGGMLRLPHTWRPSSAAILARPSGATGDGQRHSTRRSRRAGHGTSSAGPNCIWHRTGTAA
eukprot:5841210-Prymnesium_polylepis.4